MLGQCLATASRLLPGERPRLAGVLGSPQKGACYALPRGNPPHQEFEPSQAAIRERAGREFPGPAERIGGWEAIRPEHQISIDVREGEEIWLNCPRHLVQVAWNQLPDEPYAERPGQLRE